MCLSRAGRSRRPWGSSKMALSISSRNAVTPELVCVAVQGTLSQGAVFRDDPAAICAFSSSDSSAVLWPPGASFYPHFSLELQWRTVWSLPSSHYIDQEGSSTGLLCTQSSFLLEWVSACEIFLHTISERPGPLSTASPFSEAFSVSMAADVSAADSGIAWSQRHIYPSSSGGIMNVTSNLDRMSENVT